MQGSDSHDPGQSGSGLILGGAMLATASIGAALAAADHMAAVSLCGPVTGHCVLCATAAASLLASLGVIAAGVVLGREPRLDQARPGRSA